MSQCHLTKKSIYRWWWWGWVPRVNPSSTPHRLVKLFLKAGGGVSFSSHPQVWVVVAVVQSCLSVPPWSSSTDPPKNQPPGPETPQGPSEFHLKDLWCFTSRTFGASPQGPSELHLKDLQSFTTTPAMEQQKYRTAGVQERLEIVGVEDEAGNPISALTILSLLERVAGIIDNVQSCQQRMEERQQELESSIRTVQGDVMKLAKEHGATSGAVDKLLQKTRKVSANVKEVRSRVEKQNVRVKKVESTQDELLTRNKFRVVIYQGETEIPSVAVTKSPKGPGLEGLEVEPDSYDIPADLSSDEEYLSVEEAESSRATRLKKSVMKGTESIKAAFSKENLSKTKDNLGTKFHNLGEKVVPPERRERMHQAGERLKQSGERLKENIAKKAPTKESFRIKLKKERTVAEGQEGAEGPGEAAGSPGRGRNSPEEAAYTEVASEPVRERPVDEMGATRIREDDGKEDDHKHHGTDTPSSYS